METDPQSPQNQVKAPEETLRDGTLKSSIWRQKGDQGDFFTANFARTYRDDSGQLHDTYSFSGADILKLSELARKTYDRTNQLNREAYKERRQHKGQQRNHSKNRDTRGPEY